MAKNATPAAKAGANQGDAAKNARKQNGAQTNSAESTAGLEVISTRDGFRRAGLVWGKQPTIVPMAELTEAQIDMLFDEPALTVREVELPAEAKDE